MKAFVIDVAHCSGCYGCQISCKDEHCGNDWSPYAKPQPDTGQFWGKLNYYERGQIPQVRISHVFVPCQHCENAPCKAACPVDGAIYERSDGLVIIDPAKCTGCQNCLNTCPYGSIYYNAALHLAQKCTGCAHLLDNKWKEPRCADFCPHENIKFGEQSELSGLISSAERLKPDFGDTPNTRVYYMGLPKRFVAGLVYDPGAKEVVIGANCTLTGGGSTYNATTDNFGDFWFHDLPAAEFTLTISKDGKTKTMSVSTVEKDIGLGEIALS